MQIPFSALSCKTRVWCRHSWEWLCCLHPFSDFLNWIENNWNVTVRRYSILIAVSQTYRHYGMLFTLQTISLFFKCHFIWRMQEFQGKTYLMGKLAIAYLCLNYDKRKKKVLRDELFLQKGTNFGQLRRWEPPFSQFLGNENADNWVYQLAERGLPNLFCGCLSRWRVQVT